MELQAAINGFGDSALAHTPRLEVPSFARELHGSFADLVQQLQECVRWVREGESCRPACGKLACIVHTPLANKAGSGMAAADDYEGLTATAGLLRAAAALGHTSAAQQLLLIDPRAGTDELGDGGQFPVHVAASSAHGTAVLELVLQAAPDLLHAVVEHADLYTEWTLMHTAAEAGNVEAIRLLLQLAPELASIRSDADHTPLHEAAKNGCSEAVRLLLEAAPQAAAAMDERHGLPLHWAAQGGSVECLQILLDAGAPGLDCPDDDGQLPLHRAARADSDAAVRFLLAAHPGAALVEDNQRRRPLQVALEFVRWGDPPVAPNAARVLLPVSGLTVQQLLDLLAAVPAEGQPAVQPLYVDVAACMPLSPAEWQQVPTPCPGLGRALPAVLARSEAEAALLVAHLPPADTERLRVAALSLHRAQRALQLDVPPALLGRMLSLSLSDA